MAARLPVVVGPLAVLIFVTAARAEPPPGDLAQRALGHYQQGVSAYRSGRYAEAVEAFTRAHQVDPAPILVFNIAQAYWKKGDREPALEAYRRYLALDPRAPNRPQVEARIQELTAARASPVEPTPLSAAAAAPVGPLPVSLSLAPAPPSGSVLAANQSAAASGRPPFYRRALFWTVVGAVAVGVAVTVAVAARPDGGDHWSCADCNWSGARLR